jgi:ferrous iron transport protein B
MAILYHDNSNTVTDDPEDETVGLAATLRQQEVFSPATAFGFMMFVLLYFPCVATIATLRREIGWGWALFSTVNSIALAWLVAFLVNVLF